MRKVILWMMVSLDGFIEGPNQELDWHRVDEDLHTHINDGLRGAAAFLYGRTSYELMAEFWPTADADPAIPQVAEFARIWRDTPKVVFSTTMQQAGWNTRVVHGDIAAEIEALRARPSDSANDGANDGDLILLGGAGITASLGSLDLIDEYHLFVHPVLLGSGGRLLPELPKRTDLTLIGTRQFNDGVLMVHYGRRR